MKIYWASDYDNVGNAYGYTRHNSLMREYTSRLADLSEDADIALTILSADKYKPVLGKYNILFTMFEALDLPDSYVDGCRRADELIVPCRFCRDLFKRYLPGKKISVCWEGVEGEKFTFKERAFTPGVGEKFRILWVGAPNPRKGYGTMIQIADALANHPEFEIYLKTSTPKVDYESLKDKLTKEEIEAVRQEIRGYERVNKIKEGEIKTLSDLLITKGNVVFDSRNLSLPDLIDLYHSAHCFVFPTVGEGWGLTLCEAMTTGLPCVSPVHTGVSEFFSEDVGFTVRHKISEPVDLPAYDMKARFHLPYTEDVLGRILQIYNNYALAKRKAARGARLIREKFTWNQAARRLVEICEKAQSRANYLSMVA